MIYRSSRIAHKYNWTPDDNPRAGELARQFLSNELELMQLEEIRSTATEALNDFLHMGGVIAVERGISQDVLVRTIGSGESLLVTGKTAEVLRSYLDDEPVSTRDRGDMTIRRRSRNR